MKKKRSKDEIIICYNNKNSNIDIDSNYVKKDGEAKQLELIQKISLECDVGNDLLKADSEAVMTIISHLEGSEAEIISNLLYYFTRF
jgi:hypothetical protein